MVDRYKIANLSPEEQEALQLYDLATRLFSYAINLYSLEAIEAARDLFEVKHYNLSEHEKEAHAHLMRFFDTAHKSAAEGGQ